MAERQLIPSFQGYSSVRRFLYSSVVCSVCCAVWSWVRSGPRFKRYGEVTAAFQIYSEIAVHCLLCCYTAGFDVLVDHLFPS